MKCSRFCTIHVQTTHRNWNAMEWYERNSQILNRGKISRRNQRKWKEEHNRLEIENMQCKRLTDVVEFSLHGHLKYAQLISFWVIEQKRERSCAWDRKARHEYLYMIVRFIDQFFLVPCSSRVRLSLSRRITFDTKSSALFCMDAHFFFKCSVGKTIFHWWITTRLLETKLARNPFVWIILFFLRLMRDHYICDELTAVFIVRLP